jgi:Cof subfamily protein (haloacid dehalogenase superfamily)
VRKEAIVFDLDGTVVDSPVQKIPTKALANEIKRLKSKYCFCAATGRVWSFAKPVLQALDLRDPCIISSGTQICNPKSGEIIWQKTIEQEALDKVISVFKHYPNWKLLHNDGDEDNYFNGGVFPSKFVNKEPVYLLEQVFVPDEIAKEIHRILAKINGITAVMVVAQKPECRDIHIINSQATKEHSIKELLNLLGVKKENTIGIGDGYNDVHLFNAVGHKVAMGNAVPELKKYADTVIGSVSEDGMTSYLRSLCGKQS